ncbi:MAG: glycosyltransferase family 2 protein [Candidatus Syntropharchaeales archaeon]
MAGNEPGLAIIIPNYNGITMLARCLESIYNQSMLPKAVVVVDNASTDESMDMVMREFLEVKVITSQTNTGFTGGVNIGFRSVMDDEDIKYLAVINNDALIESDWIKLLVEFMEAHPSVGSSQGRVVFTGDRGINTLGIVPLKDGSAVNLGIGDKDSELPNFEIFGVSGAAALYRKQALIEAGLFDEDFFMYMEDVDLAWRLRWAGWSSFLVGKAVAIHIHSASNKNPAKKIYYIDRNSIYVCLKNLPFIYVIGLPFSMVYCRLVGSLSRRSRFTSMTKGVSPMKLVLIALSSILDTLPTMHTMMVKRKEILRNAENRYSRCRSWFREFGSDPRHYLVHLD